MNQKTETALKILLNNAIELADTSQSEIRITFQSVSLVIKPGNQFAGLMLEFLRKERHLTIVDNVITLFTRLFSISELREAISSVPNGKEIISNVPDSLDPREQFEGLVKLLCEYEFLFTHRFWCEIRDRRPNQLDDILTIERLAKDVYL